MSSPAANFLISIFFILLFFSFFFFPPLVFRKNDIKGNRYTKGHCVVTAQAPADNILPPPSDWPPGSVHEPHILDWNHIFLFQSYEGRERERELWTGFLTAKAIRFFYFIFFLPLRVFFFSFRRHCLCYHHQLSRKKKKKRFFFVSFQIVIVCDLLFIFRQLFVFLPGCVGILFSHSFGSCLSNIAYNTSFPLNYYSNIYERRLCANARNVKRQEKDEELLTKTR